MQKQCCPRGYSCLQIAILTVLRSPHKVLAYWQIAKLLTAAYGLKTSEDAVRGAIERLAKYEMLVKERATMGRLKGNRYAFKKDPCSHIPLLTNIMESTTQTSMDSRMQLDENAPPSILEEIDRKNLSVFSKSDVNHTQLLEALSEEDIKVNWPKLAAAGFGTLQIRQIIRNQEKLGNGVENVLTGLTYAEWELENNKMHSKQGELVKSPLDWVFSSLVRHGCYRKPKEYISPEEQADLNRMEELKKQKEAREARIIIEFQEWFAYLTLEKKHDILGSDFKAGQESALREYFRKNVWPTMQSDSKEIL